MAQQSSANDTPQIGLGIACEQGGRSNIEDRADARVITTAGGLLLTIAMVADGVGGSNFGERAAELTVETVFRELETSTLTHSAQIPDLLRQALETANAAVYQEGRAEKDKRGMGSTATVVAVHNNGLYLANVGDSRVYLVRGAKGERVIQLTRDHTWAREMSPRLGKTEAANHPKAEELVRSIGYAPEVKVDLGIYQNRDESEEEGEIEELASHRQGLPLGVNDRVVLCSDGLIKARRYESQPYVTETEIAQTVTRYPPEKAAPTLAQMAVKRLADDNVSAIVLEMPGSKRALYIPPIATYAALGLVALLLLVSLAVALGGRGSDLLPTRAVEATVPGGLLSAETTPTLQPRPTQPTGEVLESLTGPASYDLPDGAQLLLGPGAAADIITRAGENNASENHILLRHGLLVVEANGVNIIISNSYGVRAEVTSGLLGVSNDETAFQFSAACLRGKCRLVGDVEGQVDLIGGEESFVGGSGRPAAATPADYAPYFAIAPNIVPSPTQTLAPTDTPTPTATLTPTSTLRRTTNTPTPAPPPVEPPPVEPPPVEPPPVEPPPVEPPPRPPVDN